MPRSTGGRGHVGGVGGLATLGTHSVWSPRFMGSLDPWVHIRSARYFSQRGHAKGASSSSCSFSSRAFRSAYNRTKAGTREVVVRKKPPP